MPGRCSSIASKVLPKVLEGSDPALHITTTIQRGSNESSVPFFFVFNSTVLSGRSSARFRVAVLETAGRWFKSNRPDKAVEIHCRLAQLVERRYDMAEVTGSKPVATTTFEGSFVFIVA